MYRVSKANVICNRDACAICTDKERPAAEFLPNEAPQN